MSCLSSGERLKEGSNEEDLASAVAAAGKGDQYDSD